MSHEPSLTPDLSAPWTLGATNDPPAVVRIALGPTDEPGAPQTPIPLVRRSERQSEAPRESLVTPNGVTSEAPPRTRARLALGVGYLEAQLTHVGVRPEINPKTQLLDLAVAWLAHDKVALRAAHLRVAAKLFPGTPLDTLPAGLSGPILTHAVVAPLLAARSPLALAPVVGPPIEGVRRLVARAS
jgi:hypothetical protein